jgi:hypothetical protein
MSAQKGNYMTYINRLFLTPKMLRLLDHVRRHLEERGFRVLADGSIGPAGATLADHESAVSAPALAFDAALFIAEIMTSLFAEVEEIKQADIRRALELVIEENRRARFCEIVSALDAPQDSETYDGDWNKMTTLVAMDAGLAKAVFQHFIWQVKRKARGLLVHHHLMPVVVGHQQGSGKTTMTRKLLAPLQELVKMMSITDINDKRVGDLDRFAVGFIDDMEKVPTKNIETLKAIITAENLTRRKLNTSRIVTMDQRTTLIGTSNRDIQTLVDDPTGNRRFVQIPFRNGNVDRGGDPDIWNTVKQMNAVRLWQSVDWNSMPPIEAELPALIAHQASYIVKDDLHHWLDQLEANPALIADIDTASGVPMRKLFERFQKHTGSNWTEKRFGMEMTTRTARDGCPFQQKNKKRDAVYYKLKQKKTP